MNKIHIGNGTVYLQDYINVDLPSDNCFLWSERQDLVDKYITTDDDYYGKHSNKSTEKFKAGPKIVESVCDRYGSFQNIPARTGTITKVLSRQVFEHQSIPEAIAALRECYRVLLPGGELTIDVPDPVESIYRFAESEDEFYIRHIVGPKSKGSWGWHCMAYTAEDLINLCQNNGFLFLRNEPNIHIYPAICITFLKK